MVKKKISSFKDKKLDLKGFEEVFDLLSEDDSGPNKPKRNQVEDYEIYNYLEKEIKRLEKIDTFFRHLIPLIKEKPTVDGLIDHEKILLYDKKEEFIKKMGLPDGQFMVNMDRLFSSIFTL